MEVLGGWAENCAVTRSCISRILPVKGSLKEINSRMGHLPSQGKAIEEGFTPTQLEHAHAVELGSVQLRDRQRTFNISAG